MLFVGAVEEEFDEDMRDQVEKSARHLYGLIHARFVITSRGLAKMVCAHVEQQTKYCYLKSLLFFAAGQVQEGRVRTMSSRSLP
jgi:hypothetical protein